jgi:hypothetical protein
MRTPWMVLQSGIDQVCSRQASLLAGRTADLQIWTETQADGTGERLGRRRRKSGIDQHGAGRVVNHKRELMRRSPRHQAAQRPIRVDDDEVIGAKARKEIRHEKDDEKCSTDGWCILLCAGGTARASTSNVVEANVPFPFVVNGETLPAGKYLVQRDDMSSSVLLIRGEGNNQMAAFVSTTPDGGHDPAGSKPVLTFNRYANQYRLAGVWESGGEGWDVSAR